MLPATVPSLQGQLRGHEESMPKQIQTRREVRNRGEHKITLVAEFAPFWETRSGQRRSTVNHTKGEAARKARHKGCLTDLTPFNPSLGY